MSAPDDPIGRSGQLPHLAALHFAIHLVETRAKRLVLSRTLDVLRDADDFERAGGVVVDLGSHREDGPYSLSRLSSGVDDGADNSIAYEASATAPICSFGATRENSAMASLLGPATDGFPVRPFADEAPTSFPADFSEALVDQRNSHGSLTYGGRAAFDRPAPDIAGSEQPGQAGFER